MIATWRFMPTIQHRASLSRRCNRAILVFPIPFVAFGIASVARLADQVNDTARLIVTDLTSTDDAPEIGKLVVSYERKPAIVVSQSCDIERGKNPVLVAPIRTFQSHFPEMTLGSNSFRTRIKELANPGKNPISFPLPPIQRDGFTLPYSLVTFFEMQNIVPSDLARLRDLVKVRLSPDGLGKFQERISYLFGRFAAEDDLFFAEEHKA